MGNDIRVFNSKPSRSSDTVLLRTVEFPLARGLPRCAGSLNVHERTTKPIVRFDISFRAGDHEGGSVQITTGETVKGFNIPPSCILLLVHHAHGHQHPYLSAFVVHCSACYDPPPLPLPTIHCALLLERYSTSCMHYTCFRSYTPCFVPPLAAQQIYDIYFFISVLHFM